jgi:hypothetical protein
MFIEKPSLLPKVVEPEGCVDFRLLGRFIPNDGRLKPLREESESLRDVREPREPVEDLAGDSPSDMTRGEAGF